MLDKQLNKQATDNERKPSERGREREKNQSRTIMKTVHCVESRYPLYYAEATLSNDDGTKCKPRRQNTKHAWESEQKKTYIRGV